MRISDSRVQGLVSVVGRFEDELVDQFVKAVETVLNRDVGEIYIDLRTVTAVGSSAVPALVHARRSAMRQGVSTRLILTPGPALEALKASRFGHSFQASTLLPVSLQEPAAAPAADPAAPPLSRMTGRRRGRAGGDDWIHVLDEDEDLDVGIPPTLVAAARDRLRARVVPFGRGSWQDMPPLQAPQLGLLVLDGVVVRRLGHGDGYGAEILGPGDVLRVAPHPGEDACPWFTSEVRTVVPGRVAVLDAAFAEQAARYPSVLTLLLERTMARANSVSVSLAVAHYPRVEHRVLSVLWHLAQRFGHVTGEGMALRLPLTHSLLADLTASRRPSVTLAFQHLEERRAIVRRADGLILCGTPSESTMVAGRSA